MNFQHFNPGL